MTKLLIYVKKTLRNQTINFKSLKKGITNIGDLINIETGEIVKKAKEDKLPIKAKGGIIKEMIDRLRNKVNQRTEIPQIEDKEDKKEIYEDLGEVYLGNTGEMHLCKDSTGQEYLFKPAKRKYTDIYEEFRAQVQVIASKIQEIISPKTAIECKIVEIGDMKGTIQKKIDVDSNKTSEFNSSFIFDEPLDPQLAKQLMREYVVDYCMINYDSHQRNFIVDTDGNLRGIDKEQCLKHTLSPEAEGDLRFDQFHPNAQFGEYPPVYGKVFKDIKNGKLPVSILDEVTEGINRIRKIPREEYGKMFEPYVNSLTQDEEKRAKLRNGILKRFDSLSEVEKMVEEYKQKESLTELSQIYKSLSAEVEMQKKQQERGGIDGNEK